MERTVIVAAVLAAASTADLIVAVVTFGLGIIVGAAVLVLADHYGGGSRRG